MTGLLVQRVLPERRAGAVLAVGYAMLLGLTMVVSLGWLAVGSLVTVASSVPSIAAGLPERAAGGSAWARALLAAAANDEPLGQAVLDYAFSALNLLIAGLLLFLGPRAWATQLLAVAMIGSAGAFNLQAHASTIAVRTATGLEIGGLHQVLLHAVACAAYVAALLLLPAARFEVATRPGRGRNVLLAIGVGTLLVVGFGTALLPHTVSCILFFGFAIPLVGLVGLANQVRDGPTAEHRTQARLLVSVLLAAFGTTAVLTVLTLLLWYLGEPGLVLVDPTAHAAVLNSSWVADATAAQPTALLFWFSRLSAAGIAASVLVAPRRGGLWRAERVFSRGLVALAVIVLLGGGYIVVSAVASWLPGTGAGRGAMIAAATATALVALLFLPAYLRVERLVDRMLYGPRPTPYRVLADLAALRPRGPIEGPDLAGVAEAVGRGLGARSCRVSVLRPGLREGTYLWSDDAGASDGDDAAGGADEYVTLPIRQGTERIGSIAVDRGAVAGLHRGQRALLEDIADSLGAILQASRLGIELERQLRAALAHAEEIALSRRQAVAEMDSERRAIERDLHDGAQHHLVTLRLVLGLVEHEVSTGQLSSAAARLGQLVDQVDTIEAVLAKTVSGVSSIALSERGLTAALTADLAGADPPVVIQFDGGADRRYPPDVEAAVYFCCLEAVNNARKHALGAPVTVCVDRAEDALRFTVRDEGPGFDPQQAGTGGRGQRNLLARMTAVGGTITIDSAPGAGTTVRGTVPTRPLPATEPGETGRAEPGLVPGKQPQPAENTATAAEETPPGTEAIGAASEPEARVAAGATGGEAERAGGSLLDRLGELLDSARQSYPDGPARQRIDAMAAELTKPCRVAVSSESEAVGMLRRALSAAPVQPALELVAVADAAEGPPEARLVVLGGSDEVDPARLAGDPAASPPTIAVPLSPDEPDAVDRACQLLVWRVARPTEARRVRAALAGLTELASSGPNGQRLLYQLEQFRSGARELVEVELAEALRAGAVRLAEADREAAERLLGAYGPQPSVRLGLAADADPEEIRRVAAERLAYWRRLAGHPATTAAVRDAADVLARKCADLLDQR